MESPIIPAVLYERGVVSVECIGASGRRRSWRVDMADMSSKVLRNTIVDRNDLSIHRDRIVSCMGLGPYGPPPYEYSGTELRGDVLILIEIRDFVAGAPLSEILPFISDADAASVEDQMQEALVAHGNITSPSYGILGDTENCTQSLVDHMRSIRGSHICAGGRRCCVRNMRTPRGDERAMLCHNALTSDHVIVHSGRIVAIVGWSRCSMEPMQLQAASYAYRLDLRRSDDPWLEFIVYTILNTYVSRRDKLTCFCALIYMCRRRSSAEHSWLRSIATTYK